MQRYKSDEHQLVFSTGSTLCMDKSEAVLVNLASWFLWVTRIYKYSCRICYVCSAIPRHKQCRFQRARVSQYSSQYIQYYCELDSVITSWRCPKYWI